MKGWLCQSQIKLRGSGKMLKTLGETTEVTKGSTWRLWDGLEGLEKNYYYWDCWWEKMLWILMLLVRKEGSLKQKTVFKSWAIALGLLNERIALPFPQRLHHSILIDSAPGLRDLYSSAKGLFSFTFLPFSSSFSFTY